MLDLLAEVLHFQSPVPADAQGWWPVALAAVAISLTVLRRARD